MHSAFENLGMQFIKPGDTVYQKKAADHELLIKYLPVESPLKPYRWVLYKDGANAGAGWANSVTTAYNEACSLMSWGF